MKIIKCYLEERQSPAEKQSSTSIKRKLGEYSGFKLILLGAVIVYAIVIIKAVGNGKDSVAAAYDTAKNQSVTEIGDKLYKAGFDQAEKVNHVSNQVNLSLESIKETSKLEVLEVSDVEFITTEPDDNQEGITAVLEVPGTGIYTVDLEAAEFVTDSERGYVLMSVPEPELSEFKINYEKVNKLHFNKNGILNGSISVGEDLARSMLKDAYVAIQKEFAKNQLYYDSAKSSAINLIKNDVRELNPDVENLQVDVEFFE